jgi:hypothetical protein
MTGITTLSFSTCGDDPEAWFSGKDAELFMQCGADKSEPLCKRLKNSTMQSDTSQSVRSIPQNRLQVLPHKAAPNNDTKRIRSPFGVCRFAFGVLGKICSKRHPYGCHKSHLRHNCFGLKHLCLKKHCLITEPDGWKAKPEPGAVRCVVRVFTPILNVECVTSNDELTENQELKILKIHNCFLNLI